MQGVVAAGIPAHVGHFRHVAFNAGHGVPAAKLIVPHLRGQYPVYHLICSVALETQLIVFRRFGQLAGVRVVAIVACYPGAPHLVQAEAGFAVIFLPLLPIWVENAGDSG